MAATQGTIPAPAASTARGRRSGSHGRRASPRCFARTGEASGDRGPCLSNRVGYRCGTYCYRMVLWPPEWWFRMRYGITAWPRWIWFRVVGHPVRLALSAPGPVIRRLRETVRPLRTDAGLSRLRSQERHAVSASSTHLRNRRPEYAAAPASPTQVHVTRGSASRRRRPCAEEVGHARAAATTGPCATLCNGSR